MDDTSQNLVQNFENVLKTYSNRPGLALYNDKNAKNIRCDRNKKLYSAQEAITNVNQQIKAMQKADTVVPRKCEKNILEKYKMSSFLPVDMLPREAEITHERPANRFETQGFSDTQLIDIIDNAEAISSSNKGMTQEFEHTFCELDAGNEKSDKEYIGTDAEKFHDKRLLNAEVSKEVIHAISEKEALKDKLSIQIETSNQLIIKSGKVSQDDINFNKNSSLSPIKPIKSNSNVGKLQSNYAHNDEEITPSPVFQIVKSKSPSPLVFDLGSFEDFEKIAIPIIEENPDMNCAKRLINSQIIGKELLIGTNVKSPPKIFNEQTSPVLKVNTDRLKITKTCDILKDVNAIQGEDSILIQLNKEDNDTFLKDEILFSSDEEDEYVQMELQDIPLTCALETSFYEQADVLDKTMYVGFQTASNRSIQIATDSFTKAKTLLDEIEKDVACSTSLTELVNGLSSVHDAVNHKKTNLEKKSNVSSEKFDFDDSVSTKTGNSVANSSTKSDTLINNKRIDHDLITQEIETLKRPEKRKLDGFMTASNKKIKLSDIALARCRRVFQDIDDDCKDLGNIEQYDSREEIIHNIDDDVLQEFSREMSLIDEEKHEAVEFVGFKTASKKEIKISQAALVKTKSIFDDIEFANDTDNDFAKPSTSKGFCKFQTASFKDINISQAGLVKSNALLQDNNDKSEKRPLNYRDIDEAKDDKFIGFKTANYKNIKISKQAMLKTKQIFKDIDQEYDTNTKGSPEKNTSTTEELGMRRCVELNEELCQDLSKVFENEVMEVAVEQKSICGFQTASKKPIHISEKALLQSKKVFNDIGLDEPCDDIASSKTSKNSVVQDCLKIKSVDTKLVENITCDVKLNQKRESIKTAINKPINISDRALEKSKNIFQDLDALINIDNDDVETSPFKGFQSSRSKSITVTVDAVAKSKMLLFKDIESAEDTITSKDLEDNKICFKGFQTANNKPVSISAKALAKSKALFKDLDEEYKLMKDSEEKPSSIVSEFKGFQTANNKPITIPSKAMAKSKTLFNDLDEEYKKLTKDTEPNIIPEFKGFQTANNKLISVSEDALEKSKSIFKDLDCLEKDMLEHTKTSFVGFQTASNKQMNISAEALARSKLLFKDVDRDDDNKNNYDNDSKQSANMFKGFQTASSRPVSVSAEALAKSKALFKDIDQNIRYDYTTVKNTVPQFEGFKTANQKPISVSADALAKSKSLFKDIDDGDNIDVMKDLPTVSDKPLTSKTGALKTSYVFEDIDGYKENRMLCDQFKGFQTASNKKVTISEHSLKQTRQIFQDIDFSANCDDSKLVHESNIMKRPSIKIKTAKGNDIKISKKSLIESKVIFQNAQSSHNIKDETNAQVKAIIANKKDNLEKLIDTQIINDFEETVCTEDFCKATTPKQSKRSGSPILSCPKAKKRKKFETPYRSSKKSPSIPELKTNIIGTESTVIYSNEYKKNKRYKLKDLLKAEEVTRTSAVDPYILNFDLETILSFEFEGRRNDLTDTKLTIEDLKDYFQKSVNKKLIPTGWLDNHLKLILWKLISYEVKFPNTLSGVCKAKNVLEQLKYRYDRELYNAERPALRKILEKDDVASKTMVLCVAGIFVDGVSVKSVTNVASNVELLLTDGWYCVKACIDKMLTKLVYDERITVGCKIVTNGAELVNCEQGVSPWEDTSSVRLKLSGNSTRRARWHARLGYHGNGAILSQLSAVKPEGGKVSKLRLFVARVYPMLYVEKFEDGSTVTRSERLEHIHQATYESERQTAMEKLYEEVEKELSDQESQDSLNSQQPAKHRNVLSDSRITESQAKSLEDRSIRKREKLLQDVQERVRKKIKEKGLDVGRNVVTLLKSRVVGVDVKDGNVVATKGLLSIWKPNDLLADIIKEDSWIEVLNVVPTAIRYSEIHLSAGRQSVFSQCKHQGNNLIQPFVQTLKRICHPIKNLAENPSMTTDYNEIDTTGLIFLIDEVTNQPFQNIYLTDSEKNIICVNFWGGLKKFGFQNVLVVGQVVYGTNLQKRAGNTRKSIPQFRVTEFSYFTKTPKSVVARNSIADLEKKLASFDRKKYIEECVLLKKNFAKRLVNENVSPYRFNNEHNLSKNKMFIDSPLAAKVEDNFNLTGLDFESTFRQTQEMSPKMLERKKIVRQKIARLKMIGEPPPLSPLNIINKSKSALNSYKSPLACVASSKKTDQNSSNEKEMQSSPVILLDVKKSYQKNLASCNDNLKINELPQSSPLVGNSRIIYQKHEENIQSSPVIRPNVASIRKSYQKSSVANEVLQSSPVFSMNRTYVKNVNPVKLNFSNVQDNSLDDVVDQFAEDFEGSPPLSLE